MTVTVCDEGPRDGRQNELTVHEPETRAELVNRLASAGLRRIGRRLPGGGDGDPRARARGRLGSTVTLAVAFGCPFEGRVDSGRVLDAHTVAFLRQAGCDVEHLRLSEHGVHGNGHLMMLEKNNREALQPILDWLESKEA